MSIYHLTTQVIGRSAGRSAVAAAAYRSAERLHDERQGCHHDFTEKPGVIHKEVLLPAGAPDHFSDRERLWNEVEAREKRKDAQLCREVEFSLPNQLSPEARLELARDFVAEAFVSKGMIADLCLHEAESGKPHAHVMVTMRQADPDGLGLKAREWNHKRNLIEWRELWAVRANQALAREGHPERIDHRSYATRGIELVPQTKVGATAVKRQEAEQPAARAVEHKRIAGMNGDAILKDPWIALDFLTEHQSTFSRADISRLVNRHTECAEQFVRVMARIETHPDLVRVGYDSKGVERLSTTRMIAIERDMVSHAQALADSRDHGVGNVTVDISALGPEQRRAYEHVIRHGGLSLVVGYAGTGKSRLLGHARQAWEQAGYRVRGAALSGIAAEALEHGSGIESCTIASLEWAWSKDQDKLTNRDVLVIDEAGMVGSRQLERVLRAAKEAGAKVVAVGDPEQLQAIEAGSAFRALAERHGVVELTHVRRQRAKWMQEATKELATARTKEALERYDAAGMVHESATRGEAMAKLIAQWDYDRAEKPDRTQIILAYTRADVQVLNEMARECVRASGDLQGEDIMVQTERGQRAMAIGERVMFLQNDRGLGVKNGTLGTLQSISGDKLTIALDADGKRGAGATVALDLGKYTHLEHGYASTIHKSQGVTVSRSKVMTSRQFDRHTAYVAMSRHRGRVDVHFAREEFKDRQELAAKLGRERAKDTTLDYSRTAQSDRKWSAGMAAAIEKVAQQQRQERVPERGQTVTRQPERSPDAQRQERMAAAIRQQAQKMRERGRDTGRGR